MNPQQIIEPVDVYNPQWPASERKLSRNGGSIDCRNVYDNRGKKFNGTEQHVIHIHVAA